MRARQHALPVPALLIAAAVVTAFGLYTLHLAARERLEAPPLWFAPGSRLMRAGPLLLGEPSHSSGMYRSRSAGHFRARTRASLARHEQQQPSFGEDVQDARPLVPVIAPFLCNGPSNQIYQAKLAVWSLRADTTGATLVLPPILPHFSQRRAKDEQPVPFSAFFEIAKAPAAGASLASPAPALVEERDLWEGAAPPDVAAAVAATASRTCTVYVSDGGNATSPAYLQRLDRCKKYAAWWTQRAAGRACGGGLSFQAYAGGLADLASDMAGEGGRAGDAAGRPVSALALACYLETFLSPGILFGARDQPGGPGGSYIMEHGDRPGCLPEEDGDAAGVAWINAAAMLKFRGAEEAEEAEGGDEAVAGRPSSSQDPPPPAPPPPPPTLALQLRVPDYTVLAKNRSSTAETYCLGGALECNPAKHLVLPRGTLLDVIGGVVNGTQPAMARARMGSSPPALTHVHLLTNDDVLGADVTDFLQGRGLRVTSSPDRSLPSLMRDYRVAVNAAVFWGTRGSTISANIVHARHAAGRPALTTVLWEDVVTSRG